MNAIRPTQKDESDPINMAATNPTTIEMIEKIGKIEPDAIAAASIGPRL